MLAFVNIYGCAVIYVSRIIWPKKPKHEFKWQKILNSWTIWDEQNIQVKHLIMEPHAHFQIKFISFLFCFESNNQALARKIGFIVNLLFWFLHFFTWNRKDVKLDLISLIIWISKRYVLCNRTIWGMFIRGDDRGSICNLIKKNFFLRLCVTISNANRAKLEFQILLINWKAEAIMSCNWTSGLL